ncbi:hypothetical protein D3C87_1933350 [compost metagenome]
MLTMPLSPGFLNFSALLSKIMVGVLPCCLITMILLRFLSALTTFILATLSYKLEFSSMLKVTFPSVFVALSQVCVVKSSITQSLLSDTETAKLPVLSVFKYS